MAQKRLPEFDRDPSKTGVEGQLSSNANRPRRWLRRLIGSIVFVVLVECFVFNLPFWESIGLGEGQPCAYSTGAGLTQTSEDTYVVEDPSAAYLEISPNTHVDNLFVDLGIPPANNGMRSRVLPVVPLHVEATDAGNSAFIVLPEVNYCVGIANSHYLRVYLSGESDTVRLYLDAKDITISHPTITINVTQPFHLSIVRVAFIALIVALFQVFRPSSPLYQLRYHAKSRKRLIALVAVALCEILIAFSTTLLTGGNTTAETQPDPEPGTVIVYDYNHYNRMADAILEGSLTLDLPVAPTLSTLENPYDPNERISALSEAGEAFYVDYAYYDGAYYSYFGILPALLSFVPFKLITGHDMATTYAVALFCMLLVVALTLFLDRLFRRIAPRGSIGMFLLGDVSIFAGCGLIYSAYLPQTYSIPIVSALFFALLGLWFWLGAKSQPSVEESVLATENAADGITEGTPSSVVISKRHLIAGAVSIGLTLGCRPQFILVAFLALPIFWTEISQERLFFSRKGLANTFAVIAPIILVAIPFMMFNFARFGSPFDFGATYNLTGFDMTSHGIVLARFPVCLFEYLFQPLSIVPSFPYIQTIDMTAVDFQGLYYYEPYMGGFFIFSPIALFAILLFAKRRELLPLTLRLGGIMVVIAFVVLAADLQIASVTMRYFGDFGWLLLIAAWLAIWNLWGEVAVAKRGAWSVTSLIVAITAFGVFANFWCLPCDGRYAPLSSAFPTIYYTLQSWLSVFN